MKKDTSIDIKPIIHWSDCLVLLSPFRGDRRGMERQFNDWNINWRAWLSKILRNTFFFGCLDSPHLVHKNKWVGFDVTNITTLNFSFLTAHGISFVISLIITLVNPWNCRSTEDTSMTSKIQITLGWKQRQCISMTTRGKCWVTSNLRYMQMIQEIGRASCRERV